MWPLKSSDKGLTLLELAIAVLVLSIGALAAVRASNQSRLVIGGAEDRALAQLVARNRAEELTLLGPSAALPQTVTLSGQIFTLSTHSQTTAAGLQQLTVTANAARGPGAAYVIYLNAGPRP